MDAPSFETSGKEHEEWTIDGIYQEELTRIMSILLTIEAL